MKARVYGLFLLEAIPAFAFIFCCVNYAKGYRLYRGYAAADLLLPRRKSKIQQTQTKYYLVS